MNTQLHTLKVSAEGVMRNLADQFTSASTFIKELAQNARRAGATCVHINYDKDSGILSFEDDGVGVDSPASLLTIGESGWHDLELMERENPFGVGFASAIFAASEIRIETVSWAMSISTSALLKLQPMAVEESSRASGTRITLRLLDHVHESLNKQAVFTSGWLKAAFAGFEIPVVVNGESIDRTDRLGSGFKAFSIGHYHSAFRPDASYLSDMRIYLQGICVYDDTEHEGRRFREPAFTIHLDPSQFRARVPDRDKLINEAEIIREIRSQVKDLWRMELNRCRESLAQEEFLNRYWKVVAEFNAAELVNDLPIPAGHWAVYNEPLKFGRWDGASEEKLTDQQTSLPVGSLVIEDMGYDDESESAMAVYAFKRQFPVIRGKVPKGHWSNSTTAHLRDVNFSISEQSPIKEIKFESSNVWGMTISICESYVISTDADDKQVFPDIVVDDEPIYCPERRLYLLPQAAADNVEALLLLTGGYEEEFDADEDALDRDIDSLRDIISLAMGGTAEEAVSGLLAESTHFLRQQLAGKSFTVSFDANGDITVREQ